MGMGRCSHDSPTSILARKTAASMTRNKPCSIATWRLVAWQERPWATISPIRMRNSKRRMDEREVQGFAIMSSKFSETKECPKCKRNRPLAFFVEGRIKPWCQGCFDEWREMRWPESDPKNRNYGPRLKPPRERLHTLLSACKLRAKKRGMDFDLTPGWVASRLQKGSCEVTGLPFDFVTEDEKRNAYAPSIDRKDCRGGYTQDNCQMVIWMYNAAKSEGADEDVALMARAMCGALTLDDREAIRSIKYSDRVKDATDLYIAAVLHNAQFKTGHRDMKTNVIASERAWVSRKRQDRALNRPDAPAPEQNLRETSACASSPEPTPDVSR